MISWRVGLCNAHRAQHLHRVNIIHLDRVQYARGWRNGEGVRSGQGRGGQTDRQTDRTADKRLSFRTIATMVFHGRIGRNDEFDLESICAARCCVCWWDRIDKRTQRELMLPLPLLLLVAEQRRPCRPVDNKTGTIDNNDEFYWDSGCRATTLRTRADYIRIKRRLR